MSKQKQSKDKVKRASVKLFESLNTSNIRCSLINTMKLMTHNVLSSKGIKSVKTGYPLKIEAKDVKVSEVDFNPDFIARVIPRLDWEVVVKAAQALGQASDLPTELVENYENDQEFLKKAHHVLMEVEIINGDLVCPETGRRFPVADGIPNMLLNEDEV